MRDLDQIRAFLTGAGPIAIVDLPWIPVFLFVCFLIHPWLGIASIAGGVVLFAMTLLTERASREPSRMLARDGGHAVGPGRGRPAQQRVHRRDGHGGRAGEALGADQ